MLKSKPKEKRCSVCLEWFQPQSGLSPKVCGIPCAIKKAESDRKTKQKKANGKAKKEFYDNDRSTCIKKAEAACHAYIRYRDRHLPCISCGNTNQNAQYHAGHWLAKGSHPQLRFHELNINRQCAHCNTYNSGAQQPYRIALIEKIGIDIVEWLECNHKPQKLTLDDIKEITQYYRDKLKALKH